MWAEDQVKAKREVRLPQELWKNQLRYLNYLPCGIIFIISAHKKGSFTQIYGMGILCLFTPLC